MAAKYFLFIVLATAVLAEDKDSSRPKKDVLLGTLPYVYTGGVIPHGIAPAAPVHYVGEPAAAIRYSAQPTAVHYPVAPAAEIVPAAIPAPAAIHAAVVPTAVNAIPVNTDPAAISSAPLSAYEVPAVPVQHYQYLKPVVF